MKENHYANNLLLKRRLRQTLLFGYENDMFLCYKSLKNLNRNNEEKALVLIQK